MRRRRRCAASGVWPYLDDAAQPILDIRVADGHPMRGVSPLFLHYDHREVGSDPFGYIIENRRIRHALGELGADVAGAHPVGPGGSCRRWTARGGLAEARLADGRRDSRAQLVVAADGRFSKTRQDAGIGVAGLPLRSDLDRLHRAARTVACGRGGRTVPAGRPLRHAADDREPQQRGVERARRPGAGLSRSRRRRLHGRTDPPLRRLARRYRVGRPALLLSARPAARGPLHRPAARADRRRGARDSSDRRDRG